MSKYDCLKLENQLCFPLYACSRMITKHYKPLLDEFDLTYTQYITIMTLWDKKEMTQKELGQCLYLDSGTLTPLIKKLEAKGYTKKRRSETDERNIFITITDKGMKLRDKMLKVPASMGGCVNLPQEEAETLYKILYKILGNFDELENGGNKDGSITD
ncbi:MAG: MarR family transcriptional regulator [Eubacterium sp.]|nr:MarR family transcriptional regulator [Eubacterium sp.]